MKYIFIINPESGNKNHHNIITRIHDYMEEHKIDYDIHFTKEKGDGTLIARRYINEKNIVIYSVGGDGTLNEIVNALANTKIKLGVIPAGSGNDFYRTLKSSKKKNKKIDLGMVNDKYFINIASVGIDAHVCDNANIFKKLKFPKKTIYDFSIIYTFIKFSYQKLIISYNRKEFESKNLIVAVCNGKYYGGGYQIAPLASFDDNYFDVYFAKEVSKIKLLGLLNLLKKGEHEQSSLIYKERLKELTITSDTDIICNYDGEILKDKKLEFKMIRDSINIYNNKKFVDYIMGK